MRSLIASGRGVEWPQGSEEFRAFERNTKGANVEPSNVFAELYGVLEDYAPPWYTEQLHEQAEKALRMLGRL